MNFFEVDPPANIDDGTVIIVISLIMILQSL